MLTPVLAVCCWIFAVLAQSDCQLSSISLPDDLYGHQTIYANGYIYLFGGVGNSNIYKWDTVSPWNDIGNTPTSTFIGYTKNSVIVDNVIYFVGMYIGSYSNSKEVYLYDITTESWLDNNNINWPQYQGVYNCLSTNKTHLFLVAGQTASGTSNLHNKLQIYDIADNVWSYSQIDISPISAGYAGCYSSMVGDALYVFGGYVYPNNIDDIFKYSLQTQQWSKIGTIPQTERRGVAEYHDIDQSIYIIGGYPSKDEIFKFDTNSETVTNTYYMQDSLSDLSANIINHKLYVFGGNGDGSGAQNGIQICDVLATASPTPIPTISTTIYHTKSPTKFPTNSPSKSPSNHLTQSPTYNPTNHPSKSPTNVPSNKPSQSPSNNPSKSPSKTPTNDSIQPPTYNPSSTPSSNPTNNPSSKQSSNPTNNPSLTSTVQTSFNASSNPSPHPISVPSTRTTQTHCVDNERATLIIQFAYNVKDGTAENKIIRNKLLNVTNKLISNKISSLISCYIRNYEVQITLNTEREHYYAMINVSLCTDCSANVIENNLSEDFEIIINSKTDFILTSIPNSSIIEVITMEESEGLYKEKTTATPINVAQTMSIQDTKTDGSDDLFWSIIYVAGASIICCVGGLCIVICYKAKQDRDDFEKSNAKIGKNRLQMTQGVVSNTRSIQRKYGDFINDDVKMDDIADVQRDSTSNRGQRIWSISGSINGDEQDGENKMDHVDTPNGDIVVEGDICDNTQEWIGNDVNFSQKVTIGNDLNGLQHDECIVDEIK